MIRKVIFVKKIENNIPLPLPLDKEAGEYDGLNADGTEQPKGGQNG